MYTNTEQKSVKFYEDTEDLSFPKQKKIVN
jgi:hypothetical protein